MGLTAAAWKQLPLAGACVLIAALQVIIVAAALIVMATIAGDGRGLALPVEAHWFFAMLGTLWAVFVGTMCIFHKVRAHVTDRPALAAARSAGWVQARMEGHASMDALYEAEEEIVLLKKRIAELETATSIPSTTGEGPPG
ncbi:MAG: hypothetical protein ABIK09_09075 [Pseudomonadota bacterium]